MSSVQNVRVTRDDVRWEAEIRAEITSEALQHYRKDALKHIGKTAQISGFRAGHVPADLLVRHFGEDTILREAAEYAVKQELPNILASEKLNIVEAPRVSIETPKSDAPLAFTARAPLAPEVKLPDYKKLAAKANADKKAVTVTDDEHRETLTHFRRERARVEKIEAGTLPEEAAAEVRKTEEKDLPELDDAFVKTLGYEDATQFHDKVREHLTNEKELQAKSAHRATLLDALVKDAKISYPALLRDYELDDMEARFQSDLERVGKTLDSYLAETKKTREAVRSEWEEAADKRARIRLVLAEVARQEHIEPDQARLARELEHAQKHYPASSPDSLRAHIAHALRNEQVLEWLEKQS
jgi:FKBP-type peptidyl-prolyl cis-trans isomerase (trigger factor)